MHDYPRILAYIFPLDVVYFMTLKYKNKKNTTKTLTIRIGDVKNVANAVA